MRANLSDKQLEKLYEVPIDAFAGAAGGVVSQLLFYPINTL